jgi:hypothetical protein
MIVVGFGVARHEKHGPSLSTGAMVAKEHWKRKEEQDVRGST